MLTKMYEIEKIRNNSQKYKQIFFAVVNFAYGFFITYILSTLF